MSCFVAVLCVIGTSAFADLFETVSDAERVIDQKYTTERAHAMALKKLDAILSDASLSESDKKSRVRSAFLALSEITSANAGRWLLYTPALSWRVHSLAVAHDLDGRYESIVSRDRLSGLNVTQSVDSSDARTRSEARNSSLEKTGGLSGGAGLAFGVLPKGTAGVEGRMTKTSSSTTASGETSAWTRRDQASLNERYESVMKEMSTTRLSGLHIRFVIEFSNNTGKDMVVPAGSEVPVYAGKSFRVTAKMESAVNLNIPAYGTVDISFQGDLATTAAQKLIDFMRTESPIIAPERARC